jgi:hypothetical protein
VLVVLFAAWRCPFHKYRFIGQAQHDLILHPSLPKKGLARGFLRP